MDTFSYPETDVKVISYLWSDRRSVDSAFICEGVARCCGVPRRLLNDTVERHH